LVNLGSVLNEMGQPDKGNEMFQKALKIDKDFIPALEAVLESAIKKGNKNDAPSTLGSLVDRSLSKKDLDKALVYARQMVSLDPGLPSSQAKLGEALEKNGDLIGAADAYFKAALAYESGKKTQSYEDFLRRALEADVDHPEARERAGAGMVAEVEAKWPADRPRPGKGGTVTAEHHPTVHEAPAPEPAVEAHVRVSEAEELSAQIGIADHYAQRGMLDEAIEIYQQLMETYPDNEELKSKANRAYAAYAKTGTDLTATLSATAPERKTETDLEKMSAELAKKAQESNQKLVKEMEVKAKEESEKKTRLELERKAREEAEVQAEEELRRLVAERESKKAEAQKVAQKLEQEKAEEERAAQRALEAETERAAIRAAESHVENAMAEGDAFQREGQYEKARDVFKRIVDQDPKNLEAKRRLDDVQILMKAHGDKKTGTQKPAETTEAPGKDSDSKKRSSRIGYV
jgi:tetratricopeptide (TPR) repeat protein